MIRRFTAGERLRRNQPISIKHRFSNEEAVVVGSLNPMVPETIGLAMHDTERGENVEVALFTPGPQEGSAAKVRGMLIYQVNYDAG